MSKQKTGYNLKSLKNLPQYKDLSEEELEELEVIKLPTPSEEFEERIKAKISEFEIDFDFSDMKINDIIVLRQLAQAIVSLEDLEQIYYQLRLEGIALESITLLEKISKQMSDLRSDISKMQDDLKITRKIRKSDKDESVISFLESLKEKAHEFYQQKMSYILCPKCNLLLSTVWFLFPEEDNKIVLQCKRKLENGEVCDTKIVVSSKDLLKNKSSNKPEALPKSML